jgi:hypothetical protein
MSQIRVERCERIAGIREDLPPGEHVLWQGAPDWRSHARHAFHIREVALYFAVLAVAATVLDVADGRPPVGGAMPAALGVVACLLLAFLAWLSSRTTVYAITSRRVFLRVGIALPLTINLPLHRIQGASLAVHRDGSGDVPLALEVGPHLAFLHLWPHARPWRLKHPEPMMRSLANPEQVAQTLAEALQAAHAMAAELRSETMSVSSGSSSAPAGARNFGAAA